jgi:hypothetical protein
MSAPVSVTETPRASPFKRSARELVSQTIGPPALADGAAAVMRTKTNETNRAKREEVWSKIVLLIINENFRRPFRNSICRCEIQLVISAYRNGRFSKRPSKIIITESELKRYPTAAPSNTRRQRVVFFETSNRFPRIDNNDS